MIWLLILRFWIQISRRFIVLWKLQNSFPLVVSQGKTGYTFSVSSPQRILFLLNFNRRSASLHFVTRPCSDHRSGLCWRRLVFLKQNVWRHYVTRQKPPHVGAELLPPHLKPDMLSSVENRADNTRTQLQITFWSVAFETTISSLYMYVGMMGMKEPIIILAWF